MNGCITVVVKTCEDEAFTVFYMCSIPDLYVCSTHTTSRIATHIYTHPRALLVWAPAISLLILKHTLPCIGVWNVCLYKILIKHMLVYTKPYNVYKCLHVPPTVKLSVAFSSVPLKHITVVSFLLIVLDTVTCRVEVKLACRLAWPVIMMFPTYLISWKLVLCAGRL